MRYLRNHVVRQAVSEKKFHVGGSYAMTSMMLQRSMSSEKPNAYRPIFSKQATRELHDGIELVNQLFENTAKETIRQEFSSIKQEFSSIKQEFSSIKQEYINAHKEIKDELHLSQLANAKFQTDIHAAISSMKDTVSDIYKTQSTRTHILIGTLLAGAGTLIGAGGLYLGLHQTGFFAPDKRVANDHEKLSPTDKSSVPTKS